MDDQPTTKQASSPTTVMLIWTLSGVILVSAVYFLTPSPGPWPALNAAGLAAGLYLVALLFFIARKPVRVFARIALVVLAFTAVGATAFTWVNAKRYIERQREYFKERSEVSVRGMIFNSASGYLLQTLRTNRENSWTKSQSLDDIFRLRNTNVTVGRALTPIGYYSSIKVFVETLEPDRIVLTAMEQNSAGRNPEFLNYNGTKGFIQEKFTLTRKGLVHESQN